MEIKTYTVTFELSIGAASFDDAAQTIAKQLRNNNHELIVKVTCGSEVRTVWPDTLPDGEWQAWSKFDSYEDAIYAANEVDGTVRWVEY